MKKLGVLFLLLFSMSFVNAQTVNINDCNCEILSEISDKYVDLLGKKLTLFSNRIMIKAKITEIGVSPKSCNESILSLNKKNKKYKTAKFNYMQLTVKEGKKVKKYMIGYQLFLAMLKAENSKAVFIDKLTNDKYQFIVNVDQSISIVSY